MIVIKRDGREVPFNKQKIIDAISKAMRQVGVTDLSLASTVADSVFSHFYKEDGENTNEVKVKVEEIQDIVEDNLMSLNKDVAKCYIKYRYLHDEARTMYYDLMDTVSEKLTASNVQNQNANVDEYSFGGRMGEANGVVTRKYALEYLVSPMARKNHENNEIYIHDLDHYAVGDHNCLSIPFDDLLKNGFNTRQTDVRPAQSINTAFQLIAVIFQLQSLQQFGGVSATHIDWTLVPYVRKSFYKHWKDGMRYCEGILNPEQVTPENTSIDDKFYTNAYDKAYKYAMDMTIKECYQAVEGMYHNLNTLQSRSGNQLPFTSINYGTCTLPEGRMVTKALLDVSIKGIGKLHKTSIFPCGIFQCMKGVNRKEGDPNYDLFRLALESTSQRLYPNYANVDWSGNKGYDVNNPETYFSTINKTVA